MLYRSDFQVLGKGQWGSLGHCCSAPDGFYYWMEDRKVWRWLGTREAVLWAILNRTNSTDLVGSARTPAWDIEADMQNASYVIFWCTAPLIYISIYIFWWTLCSFWNFHLFLFLCDNSKLEVLFCLFYIFTVGICHFTKGGCCCEYTLVLLGFSGVHRGGYLRAERVLPWGCHPVLCKALLWGRSICCRNSVTDPGRSCIERWCVNVFLKALKDFLIRVFKTRLCSYRLVCYSWVPAALSSAGCRRTAAPGSLTAQGVSARHPAPPAAWRCAGQAASYRRQLSAGPSPPRRLREQPGHGGTPAVGGSGCAQARGGSALSRGVLLHRGRRGRGPGRGEGGRRKAKRLDAGGGGICGAAQAVAPGPARLWLAKWGGLDLACGWVQDGVRYGSLSASRMGAREARPGGGLGLFPGAESRGRGPSGARLLCCAASFAVRAVEAAAVGFYWGSAFMARRDFLLLITDVFSSNLWCRGISVFTVVNNERRFDF